MSVAAFRPLAMARTTSGWLRCRIAGYEYVCGELGMFRL